MNKKWLVLTGIVLLLPVLAVLTGCEQGGTSASNMNLSTQQQGIWVNGTGEVSAAPDIAILRLGIEAQNTSVTTARDRAAEAMDEVMNALSRSGVAEKDIQTSYFSIQQVSQWDRETGEETVTGYRVINTVTVTIRDMEKTETVIDSVADAGGDLTRINSISFSIEDPSDYYDMAREDAVGNAKDKAEQLAKLAGVNLGKVTYLQESTYYAPVSKSASGIAYDEGMSVSTSISPGELDISVNLQVAYAIK